MLFNSGPIIVRVASSTTVVLESRIVSWSIENQIRTLPYRSKLQTLLHRVGDSSTLLVFLVPPIIKFVGCLVIGENRWR